jgi:hypothetical protein
VKHPGTGWLLILIVRSVVANLPDLTSKVKDWFFKNYIMVFDISHKYSTIIEAYSKANKENYQVEGNYNVQRQNFGLFVI